MPGAFDLDHDVLSRMNVSAVQMVIGRRKRGESIGLVEQFIDLRIWVPRGLRRVRLFPEDYSVYSVCLELRSHRQRELLLEAFRIRQEHNGSTSPHVRKG